jgi:putative aldouronate transport system substrate-binding protein
MAKRHFRKRGISMKVKFNKVIAYITLASLLGTTVACSTPGSSPKDTANPDGKKTDSKQPLQAQDPLQKYDPPIEVTAFSVSSTTQGFVEGENWDNNVITKLFSDMLGVNYKNKWTVDGSKASEKFNVAIASNDLPDIMRVDINQMGRLMKNDQLEDMTPYYQAYTTEMLRKNLELNNKSGFIPGSKDGKMYSIPINQDVYIQAPIMFLRKDWLEKLGLPVPKTIDEVKNVLKAFVQKDPDGNGKNDTYGVSLDKGLGMTFDSLAAAFNAYRAMWIKDSTGNLVYGSIQPEMKTALKYLQEMFKEGLIDPEFAAKERSKVMQEVGAGKSGIFFGTYGSPNNTLRFTRDHTPTSDWVGRSIPTGLDGTVLPPRGPSVNVWMAVRKGAKNPEALFKSMSLWAELWMDIGKYNKTFYDIQGSDKYSPYQIHTLARPYFFDDPYKNNNIAKQFREAYAKNDPSLVKHPDGIWKWKEWEKKSSSGWAYMAYAQQSFTALETYKDKYQENQFYGPPTETMEKRSATLDKLEYETFIKIIMGAAPIEEFDNFVKLWKSLGGDQITQEVNAYAKTNK